MEPTTEESPSPVSEGPDLSRLERIEGELHAVERALEQIDQGVYHGFTGLDVPVESAGDDDVEATSPTAAADR
ncbi:MAG: hypothetical protein ACSLFP_06580 [Acidimicrobiales bacterium]